jgi:hypothetical protein
MLLPRRHEHPRVHLRANVLVARLVQRRGRRPRLRRIVHRGVSVRFTGTMIIKSRAMIVAIACLPV